MPSNEEFLQSAASYINVALSAAAIVQGGDPTEVPHASVVVSIGATSRVEITAGGRVIAHVVRSQVDTLAIYTAPAENSGRRPERQFTQFVLDRVTPEDLAVEFVQALSDGLIKI